MDPTRLRQRALRPAEVVRGVLYRPLSVSNSRYFILTHSFVDIDGWWVLWGSAFIESKPVPLRPEHELPGPSNGWPLMIRPIPQRAIDDPVKFITHEIMADLIHPWSPEIEAEIVARKARAA